MIDIYSYIYMCIHACVFVKFSTRHANHAGATAKNNFDCEQLFLKQAKFNEVENSTPLVGREPTTPRLLLSSGNVTLLIHDLGFWLKIRYWYINRYYQYIYICIFLFVCKVYISNASCAQAITFSFESWKDTLEKVLKASRQKMSLPKGLEPPAVRFMPKALPIELLGSDICNPMF